MANIFEKESSPVAPPSTGVRETHSLGTMQSSLTMIRWKGNLGRISEFEKVSFQMMMEDTMLFDGLSCSESAFQRVGTVTEKARVPA